MAGKSIYRLMLDDDLVSAIDRFASNRGLTRSAMIEKMLSDRISYLSPLSKVSEIYEEIDRMISAAGGFTAYNSDVQSGFTVKSAIARYRPSVRYQVRIYDRLTDGDFGRLKAVLRTDDSAVLENAEEFIRAFCRLERIYVSPSIPEEINCGFDIRSGVFARGLRLAGGIDHTAADISRAITGYVSMLDTMMKRWFGREYRSMSDMESDYLSYLSAGIGII